jgi:hypothetical protein
MVKLKCVVVCGYSPVKLSCKVADAAMIHKLLSDKRYALYLSRHKK